MASSTSDSESESHQELSRSNKYYKDDSRRSRKKHSKRSKVRRDSSDSMEPRRKKRYSSDRSRSRSRSNSPYVETRYREEDRDNPPASHCLGVFGLSVYTDEKDLEKVFSEYGAIERINLIYDREIMKSKGFGFVYFKNLDDAAEARKGTQGLELDGRPIRVDFSLTTRPHPPTPGKYLGRVNQRNRDFREFRDYDRGSYGRGYHNRGGYGGGGGGYGRGRRDYGGYSRGGGRRPSYRQYDDQYYDDYQESNYHSSSSRRRRYSSPQYSSRHY